MRLFKQFILVISGVLLTTQFAFSAAVYEFRGAISAISSTATQAELDYYAQNGISVGGNVGFTISLDGQRQGTQTNPDGSLTYKPYVEHFGTMTSQDFAYGYAELSSSSIPTSFLNGMNNTTSNNYYYDSTYAGFNSPQSSWSYNGSILVGPRIDISTRKAYSDLSAFVSNWQVGDSFQLNLLLAGVKYSGQSAIGALTLVAKTGALPPSPIPLPPAIGLFVPALFSLGLLGRRKRRAS